MLKKKKAILIALMLCASSANGQTAAEKPFLPSADDKEGAQGSQQDAQRLSSTSSHPRRYLLREDNLHFDTPIWVKEFSFSADANSNAVLSLGYRTGVAVDARGSAMIVSVNGNQVASETLSGGADGRLEISVPQTMLVNGENTIRVRVHQSNAACTTTSSVWVEMRPETTWVETALNQSAFSVDPGPDGITNVIVLRGDDKGKQSALSSLNAAMLANNIAGDGESRIKVVTSVPDDVVADVIINVSGSNPADLNNVLTLDQISQAAITPYSSLAKISSGQRINFNDLGVPTEGWSQPIYSKEMTFQLPEDFYYRFAGEMDVILRGTAVETIDPSSRVDVYVNDVISSSSQMPSQWRDGGYDWNFKVPMRHTRPGINRVRFEFISKDSGGDLCASFTQDLAPRMALFGTSEIRFPYFAKAERTQIANFMKGASVNLVMNPANNDALSLASQVIISNAQFVERMPNINIIEPSPSIEAQNVLVVATTEQEILAYGPIFGMSNVTIRQWLDNVRRRVDEDHQAAEVSAGRETEQNWAVNKYINRDNMNQTGASERIVRIYQNALNSFKPSKLSVRAGDIGLFLSRKGVSGGDHTFLAVPVASVISEVEDSISEIGVQDWDNRIIHIETDGDVLSDEGYTFPVILDKSPQNLRLVATNLFSRFTG